MLWLKKFANFSRKLNKKRKYLSNINKSVEKFDTENCYKTDKRILEEI